MEMEPHPLIHSLLPHSHAHSLNPSLIHSLMLTHSSLNHLLIHSLSTQTLTRSLTVQAVQHGSDVKFLETFIKMQKKGEDDVTGVVVEWRAGGGGKGEWRGEWERVRNGGKRGQEVKPDFDQPKKGTGMC